MIERDLLFKEDGEITVKGRNFNNTSKKVSPKNSNMMLLITLKGQPLKGSFSRPQSHHPSKRGSPEKVQPNFLLPAHPQTSHQQRRIAISKRAAATHQRNDSDEFYQSNADNGLNAWG